MLSLLESSESEAKVPKQFVVCWDVVIREGRQHSAMSGDSRQPSTMEVGVLLLCYVNAQAE